MPLYAEIMKAGAHEQVIWLNPLHTAYVQVSRYLERNCHRLEVVSNGFCNHDEYLKKGKEPERIIEVIKEYHNGSYRARRQL